MIFIRLFSLIDVRVVFIVKLVMVAILVLTLLPAFSEVTPPPAAAVQLIVPIDVVALVQAFFTGIGAIGGVVATIYAIWAKRMADAAAREAAAGVAKINAVSVQIDGLLKERDRANVFEGEQKGKQAGEDAAYQLAEGQRQGREAERESAAAKGPATSNAPTTSADGRPLSVEDDRTATASERVASATERAANATQRVATATEEKK